MLYTRIQIYKHFVMFNGRLKFNTLRNLLCVLLLCIMGWQQWATLLKHHEKFLDPIQFTKDNFATDDVSQYGKRFEEIKKMFSKPTRITYIGENIVTNSGTREFHFALTQYYLAPNLFLRTNIMHDSLIHDNGSPGITPASVIYDTVLFNLYSSGHIVPENNYFIKNGWHILKDFDNGLILLTK